MGPGITTRITLRTDQELATLVRAGLPSKGMPGFHFADAELRQLLAYVRTLGSRRREAPAPVSVHTSDDATLSGFLLNRSADDMQVLADDGTLQLFRKDGSRHRRVTSQVDWPTYHGAPHGNRYSPVGSNQPHHGRASCARLDLHVFRRLSARGHADRRRRASCMSLP